MSPVLASGLLFVFGVVVAVTPSGSDRVAVDPRSVRRSLGEMAAGVGAAALVAVTSGWLLPAVVVGAGTWLAVHAWHRRQHSGRAEVVRLEALASWIESVRDVLLAGEQPVGAIAASVAACQPVIRPHVRRLAAGLGRQDPELAFRRFADDLDDPVGDLVAAGLSIAVRRGARAVAVLTSLAEQTRSQVERRRLVEAERAPTRREVQALTLIMGGLVIGLLAFGRSSYLDAYDTGGGQAFLSCALAGYALLIARVQKLAAFPRPGRFLTTEQVAR